MERFRKFYSDITVFQDKQTDSTLNLYREVFGEKNYSSYIRQLLLGDTRGWDWRYRQDNSIRLVALQEDGQVVGHLGAMLREIQIEDGYLKGAEIIEGVVTHSLRGGVILHHLIQEMRRKLVEESRVEFAFLFPNRLAAVTVLKRASAQREAFLWEMAVELSKEDIKCVLLNGEEFVNLASSLFFQRLSKNPGTARTREYLHWRYLQNPSDEYKFVVTENDGALAVIKLYDQSKGHVVDLVSQRKADFVELINGCKAALVADGAKSISCYPLARPESLWLEEMGFNRHQWGRRMVMFTADPYFPSQELVNSWYLTMNEHSIF